MSQSTTIRFFGILKNLFSKQDTKTAPVPAADPAARTASPAFKPVAPRHVAAAAAPRAEDAGKTISLPLQTVIMSMSQELRAKVRSAVGADLTISIPFEKVVSQLGKGAIKIPFGDLRRAAPNTFSTGIDCDHLPVTLPLSEVLPLINPSALNRRTGQKQVKVADEIVSPFASHGKGLTVLAEKPRPSETTTFIRKPASPSVRAASPGAPGLPVSSLSVPDLPPFAEAPAIPATPPIAMAPVTPFAPAAPQPAVGRAAPIPFVATPPTAAPATAFASSPFAPATSAAIPFAAKQPAVAAATPNVVSTLNVTISDVMSGWPEAVRHEVAKLRLTNAPVGLPANLVEVGLKRGRVAFKWKSIRSWVQPNPVSEASAHDAVELELPLAMIAPLFLARQKGGAPAAAQKLAVDETIPNLFFGFPGAEAAPPPVERAAMPVARVAEPSIASIFAPVAPAVAAPEPEPVVPNRPADTNYYTFAEKPAGDTATSIARNPAAAVSRGGTDFMSRHATPNDIVSRASALEGVAGALIALPDGLKVAGRIPPDLNGDTLAAFLPQLFIKMSQCTKELRMGELNNLNFTVGNVPWKIFRVNAVFFAAFGRAGEPMPSAQLALLAGELDRKNKQ